MAASNLVQELHSIGDRLLLKLQRLPQAEPVEILAFSVLVVFTATVVLLLLIACGFCCCQYCCPRRRGRRTQVGPMTPP
ncbi:small integral membrane protein 5 [Moschus berezovskii]|uniref:Small integral membrane protein 5 n=1 Tax=Moschus moschiferus TaxID=68415 RepID=A0A8C6FML7_MOSMO|nr:small integral membrane protein 5 [Moschus berezovskii]XP_055264564.1 small integral membrane protein 5 [Moschus berezovskii]